MKKQFCIGYYNLENLFDIYDDPHTFDEDFTPSGKKRWTANRYKNKLHKIAKTIAAIGQKETGDFPVLMGLSEVENKKVLEDLLQTTKLKDSPLQFVHYDSPDERGIDNALLYNPHHFMLTGSDTISMVLENEDGSRDYTRDILKVTGLLLNVPVYIYVIHLPSRRHDDVNKEKRKEIMRRIRMEIDEVVEQEKHAHVLVLGDFNANPSDDYLRRILDTEDDVLDTDREELFNPMEFLERKNLGSLKHKDEWLLFDQILLSRSFLFPQNPLTLKSAAIFAPEFLQEWDGPFKGNPFRTYVGKRYLGGYSDHFPVYAILQS